MIYFVTVNYQSQPLIENLIQSISDSIKADHRIVIVNNFPEEISLQDLRGDTVEVLESGANLGFGKACNLGISHIHRIDKAAVIWLINPDTTLDDGADGYVLACLNNEPSISILGTQIRDVDNKIWFSAGEFNPWNGHLYHQTNRLNHEVQSSGARPSMWVSGCSLIINLSQFDHCPSFDPHFFLYAEDADFCISYRKKGYQVAVTNQVLVTHQVSAIIGKNKSFMYEHYTFGRLFFLKKHATPTGFALYLAYLLAVIAISRSLGSEKVLGRWRGLKRFYGDRDFNLNESHASYTLEPSK